MNESTDLLKRKNFPAGCEGVMSSFAAQGSNHVFRQQAGIAADEVIGSLR